MLVVSKICDWTKPACGMFRSNAKTCVQGKLINKMWFKHVFTALLYKAMIRKYFEIAWVICNYYLFEKFILLNTVHHRTKGSGFLQQDMGPAYA